MGRQVYEVYAVYQVYGLVEVRVELSMAPWLPKCGGRWAKMLTPALPTVKRRSSFADLDTK